MLIHEDGNGLSNAESYVSLSVADAYHASRGATDWSYLQNVEREQALRRATDYIQQTCAGKWLGSRLTATQALDWPRSDVVVDGVDVSGVPVAIQHACAELAVRAASGPLIPDEGSSFVAEKKVGPIQVKYEKGVVSGSGYRSVSLALAAYMQGGIGGSVRLERA